MAKPVRGLPDDFVLDLPDEGPVKIGDFLDEAPVIPRARTPEAPKLKPPARPSVALGRTEDPTEPAAIRSELPRTERARPSPAVIRYQLNLTPRSKVMLEELVEHIRNYGPQPDVRTSEVFQAIMQLVHNAMDRLELADLPKRGAWGSVTAKNFPMALSEAFERAIKTTPRT